MVAEDDHTDGPVAISLAQLYQEIDDEEKLLPFDKSLFQKIGRYQVMFSLGPHLGQTKVVQIVSKFRMQVENVMKAHLLVSGSAETGVNKAQFDPLLVRQWCGVRVNKAGETKIGGMGGVDFSWTEEQREYMYAVWDLFQNLVEEEAEVKVNAKPLGGGGSGKMANFRRVLQSSLAEDDTLACAVVENEESWSDRLERKMEGLRETHFGTSNGGHQENKLLIDIEAKLKRRQEFIDDTMKIVTSEENMSKDAKDKTKVNTPHLRDLLLLSDHMHILLPDLARRIAEEMRPQGVGLIPRVAPHVSQQYRGEQKDFFLLENMRRIRFEKSSLFAEMLDKQLNPEETNESGLMIAKCGAGCACC
ncbi:unnamed protein product [Amoebophrya sp. A120]|nr:unnamed protein product [Amoebophrya sp. A120]|eukprot:GSA120T00006285001.1